MSRTMDVIQSLNLVSAYLFVFFVIMNSQPFQFGLNDLSGSCKLLQILLFHKVRIHTHSQKTTSVKVYQYLKIQHSQCKVCA